MAEFVAPKTDAEIVQADKRAIYLGNLFTVEANLPLRPEGRFGSTIMRKSMNPEIIRTMVL